MIWIYLICVCVYICVYMYIYTYIYTRVCVRNNTDRQKFHWKRKSRHIGNGSWGRVLGQCQERVYINMYVLWVSVSNGLVITLWRSNNSQLIFCAFIVLTCFFLHEVTWFWKWVWYMRSVQKKPTHCWYSENGLCNIDVTWQPRREEWNARVWSMMTSLY